MCKHAPVGNIALRLAAITLSTAPLLAGSEQLPWQEIAGDTSNSPGVTVTAREVQRGTQGKYSFVRYEFAADGFPAENCCDIWYYDLNQSITDKGPFRLAEQFDPNDVTLTSTEFIKGEWFEIGVVSKDKQTRGFVKVIPFPIEAFDGPCHVWMETIVPGKAFGIFGAGFVPGEQVTTISQSGRERMEDVTQIAANGMMPITVMYPANKQRKYDASFTVIGSRCRVEVPYQWGKPALEKQ